MFSAKSAVYCVVSKSVNAGLRRGLATAAVTKTGTDVLSADFFAGKTMKAAIVNKNKQLDLVTMKIPSPGKTELLVKVCACGCCHTDIHAIDGDWPVAPKGSLCPGHEGVGTVVQAGANATNHKVGDRVGIAWLHSACGNCEFCLGGWETLCTTQQNAGYSVDGAYAEYAIASDSHAIPIPEGLDSAQAAPILCAGVTSYKAIKVTNTKPGQFLAIIGAAGGLGHLGIQYANAMGLRVVAIDVGQEKLDYCTKLGAEFVVNGTGKNAAGESAVEQIQRITGGGVHGVACFATQKAAFASSIDMARRNGTIVCVGLPPGAFETPIFDVVLKGLTIRGSIVGSRQDAAEALDFAARGLVKCNVETAKLDDVNNIMARLRSNKVAGRIVLTEF